METKVLELSDAAAQIHGTTHFVRTLISNGELKFLKVGKKFCVTQEALDNWVRRAQGHPGEADLPRTSGQSRAKPSVKPAK